MPGPQLRAYIVRATSEHPTIHSMAALARAADVSQRTLTNWFSDQTTPRTEQMSRVAAALGVSLSALWDAYGVEIRGPEEERLAALIEAAFERGFAAGFQACRDGAGSR